MAREIPVLVRAAAGLAATVLDEARKLPETLPGLPVRVIGLAMQQAMRIQQHYAGLVARGDELFTGLRGEDEPGLATFDEDLPAPATGFRESAFDRAADFVVVDNVAEDDFADLLEDEEADAVVDAVVAGVEELVEQVELAQQTIEVIVEDAPSTNEVLEEVLDELAIEELVRDTERGAAETGAPAPDAAVTEDAVAVESALLESAEAQVRTPAAPAEKAAAKAEEKPAKKAAATKSAPEKAPAKKAQPQKAAAKKAAPAADAELAEAAVPAPAPTKETGAPAPETSAPAPAQETPAPAAAAPAKAAAAPLPSPSAPPTPPIDGYDDFSIAQLRGHLRGYAEKTVQELLAYEEAGLSREPYLRMLRNRLERLRSESSPAGGPAGA